MDFTNAVPSLPIVFEDRHLMVINKPAGLLSQGDHTGDPDVVGLAKEYLLRSGNQNNSPFVGPVHRLDRPVSGLMLLAKSSKDAQQLSEQIKNRTIQKIYRAIVEGKPPPNGLLVHHLLKNNNRNIVRVVNSGEPKAKRAELSFVRIEHKETLAQLSVHLQTGRSHQIRVQLAEAGYPIWGDYKYGLDQPDGRDMALQAAELVFDHPATGKQQVFKLDRPEDAPWNRF